MAKRTRETTERPAEQYAGDGEQTPDKRGFWARFFEPLPEDEDAPEEEPEFDDDEEEEEPPPPKKKKKKRPAPPAEEAYSPEEEAEAALAADEPSAEPDQDVSDETDLAADEPAEAADGEAPIEPSAAQEEAAPQEPWERTYDAASRTGPRYGAWRPPAESTRPRMEEEEASEETPIRLFDDREDGDEEARRRDTTRTRLIRTGAQTTTRIHLNETEETRRTEAARLRAAERAAQQKQEAAAQRSGRRKKRQSTLRKLFGNVAFVLFFIVAVALALYYGFLLSDVVIMGNDAYTSDYILELSGLKTGTHMLLCDLDKASDSISENPYLQVDSINYIFPSRIRIVVTERKEAAGIVGLDYNVIIDRNGYVLSMSGGTDVSQLLQVTGVSMTGFQLGQRLGEGNDFTTATLIQLIEKLEEYELMDAIASIDLTTPLAITMTAKNGLLIHIGQSTDLDAKMQSLKKLLPQFVNQSIGNGTLYLSAKGGTVYSPAGAEGDALANMAATAAAAAAAPEIPLGYVDNDNDGIDDDTGEPIVTPDPNAAVTPPPTPTPRVPGGASDAFSG